MSLLTGRHVDHTTGRMARLAEWIVGVAGVVAVVTGAWMRYGPADGHVSLFGWGWNTSDLGEAWPFGLIVTGGVLVFTGFAALARKMHRDDGMTTTAGALAGLVSSVGAVIAVVYALVWIF